MHNFSITKNTFLVIFFERTLPLLIKCFQISLFSYTCTAPLTTHHTVRLNIIVTKLFLANLYFFFFENFIWFCFQRVMSLRSERTRKTHRQNLVLKISAPFDPFHTLIVRSYVERNVSWVFNSQTFLSEMNYANVRDEPTTDNWHPTKFLPSLC